MIFERKKFYNLIELPKISVNINEKFSKILLKINKSEKNFSLIKYIPNIKCYSKLEKIKIKGTNLKINERYTPKMGISLEIQKITPEILLYFLQEFEIIDKKLGLLIEDFCEYKFNDIDFYIHKTLLTFEEMIDEVEYCELVVKILQADFINYFYKNHKYFKNLKIDGLGKFLANRFEEYLNNIDYLQRSFEYLATLPISLDPSSLQLNLPKQILSVKKFPIGPNENQFYSKITTTTQIFCINTLQELFDTILYFIISENISIKRCKHCNRLFIPTRKDTAFCHNPSPERKTKTCQQLRTHYNSKQTQQKQEIQKLYDQFYTICTNKKGKNPDYNTIWNNFKNIFSSKQEDIYHFRYTRNKMIKWLNSVINNPLKLLDDETPFPFLKI